MISFETGAEIEVNMYIKEVFLQQFNYKATFFILLLCAPFTLFFGNILFPSYQIKGEKAENYSTLSGEAQEYRLIENFSDDDLKEMMRDPIKLDTLKSFYYTLSSMEYIHLSESTYQTIGIKIDDTKNIFPHDLLINDSPNFPEEDKFYDFNENRYAVVQGHQINQPISNYGIEVANGHDFSDTSHAVTKNEDGYYYVDVLVGNSVEEHYPVGTVIEMDYLAMPIKANICGTIKEGAYLTIANGNIKYLDTAFILPSFVFPASPSSELDFFSQIANYLFRISVRVSSTDYDKLNDFNLLAGISSLIEDYNYPIQIIANPS